MVIKEIWLKHSEIILQTLRMVKIKKADNIMSWWAFSVVAGMLNDRTILERVWHLFYFKVKNTFTIPPSNTTLKYLFKRNEDICPDQVLPVNVSVLFIVALTH